MFQQMLPGLLKPGGYDYTAVQTVLGIHGVSAPAQRAMLPTIVSLIEVIEAERRKRGDHAGQ